MQRTTVIKTLKADVADPTWVQLIIATTYVDMF